MNKSFIESLATIFLEKVSLPLFKLNQGEDIVSDIININPEEIYRHSGELFITSIMANIYDLNSSYTIFELINYLSAQTYEGNHLYGKLLFAKENHESIKMSFKFSAPINFSEKRKIRKLMEISNDDLYLYSDGSKILGFCGYKNNYNPVKQDLFVIVFTGLHKWELMHDKNSLMIVENTVPSIAKPKLDQLRFSSSLKFVFPEISQDQCGYILKICNSAIHKKTGSLIIVSKNPEKEVVRLRNQSFEVKPFKLDETLIKSLINIDGAIFIDIESICYGIGVILDGMALENGLSERGARYNSALRYIDSEKNKNNNLAIIISEDGMVDMYY